MAEDETIEVSIYADGKVEIDVKGTKGQKCLDITASLEKALGSVKKEDRSLKDEIYEQDKSKETRQNQQL